MRRHLDETIETVVVAEAALDLRTVEGHDRLAAAIEGARFLRAAVAEVPGAADHVRPRLLAQLGAATADDVRTRLLDILVWDDDPRARHEVRATLDRSPTLPTTAALLHLAETGEIQAARLLRVRVATSPGADEELLLGAVYFAFRDDPIGLPQLRPAGAQQFDSEHPHRSAVVAAARARLGSPGAWSAYLAALATWCEGRLAANALSEARIAVLGAGYAAQALSGETPPVASLRSAVFAFGKRWTVSLDTAAAVRAALADLRR